MALNLGHRSAKWIKLSSVNVASSTFPNEHLHYMERGGEHSKRTKRGSTTKERACRLGQWLAINFTLASEISWNARSRLRRLTPCDIADSVISFSVTFACDRSKSTHFISELSCCFPPILVWSGICGGWGGKTHEVVLEVATTRLDPHPSFPNLLSCSAMKSSIILPTSGLSCSRA